MASTVNKRINIWVNGKEVENNIKSIRAAISKLINEQAKMTIGSKEYVEHSEKIRKLKSIYEEHRKSIKATSEELDDATKKMKGIFEGAAVGTIFTSFLALRDRIVSSISEYVEAFVATDDALAAVRKTTGMTTAEVEALAESLKKVDTRTATNELLKIAEEGGRLGIAKEEIEAFAIAVDKANVALGDSFAGGAEEIATVLGKIRNAYKETADAEIGDSFNRIGSVINELGASSAASEGNIANFTQRVGAMPDVLKPSIQEAMALGAAFEENSVDAEIASRSYGILMKTAASDIGTFATAMGESEEAMRALINTSPVEFALKFAESMRGMNATQTAEYLKDLGLNADGVTKILGALSNNAGHVRDMITLANTAFSEATSLTNEFNVVNNNAAAQLDKAKKAVADASAELGESLAPVLITITNSSASFLTLLGNLAKVMLNNKGVVIAVAGAYATLYAIKNKAFIQTKLHAAQTAILNGLYATKRTVMLAAALAQATFAKNTTRAAAAQRALKAAFASTPWGAIITAVVALVAGIAKLATSTSESTKRMAEFNTQVAKEEREAKALFEALGKLEEGSEAYKNVLQQILDKYPFLLQKQVDESGNLKNLKTAYDEVTKSIKSNTAARLKSEKISEAEEDYFEQVGKRSARFNVEQMERINEMIEAGKNAEDIVRDLGFETYMATVGTQAPVLYKTQEYKDILKLVELYRDLAEEKDKINKMYDPYIPKETVQTTPTQTPEQIEEEKRKAEESKKAAEEAAKAWSDYYKKVEDFRSKNHESQLNEWAKTKAQIEKQYNELIKEANTFGAKGKKVAAQLEKEKGDAIIKAGNDYLEKYAKFLTQFGEEANDMLQNTQLTDEQSQLAKDLFGDQKEWDEKLKELQQNIDLLKEVVGDMEVDDDGYEEFEKMLTAMEEKYKDALLKRTASSANIINRYIQDQKNFVQNETEALRQAQMSEYDREIAAIDARYDAEIRKVEETIAAKKQLIAAGGDAFTITSEIQGLEKLIQQMNDLREQAKAAVPKNDFSEVSSWERLFRVMKMTPEEFKNNWRDALKSTADAMGEFANAAIDIMNSINQIKDNRDQAELDRYNELQDQKLAALQNYYDQGIYSEKYYNAMRAKIEADKEKKEREVQREKFNRDKRAAIVEATIKGIQAAVTSFASLGFPWGLIPMALSLATTAAQIAAISSQANPYAKGGWIRQKQLILAGEEGQEWVASNKLLQDKNTRPVINALEEYQRGNTAAFDALRMPAPKGDTLYHGASAISRTFAENKAPVVYNINNAGDDNKALLKEIKTMNKFLSDPRNRQAYITRKQQQEYEAQENELRKYAKL